LEADCLHYADRVGEREDGEDEMLGERSPGRTMPFEPRVSRCQYVPIGAWVVLLRCCWRESRNP
jgi:hypothetical protein